MLQVLVASLMLTLLGRLWYVEMLHGERYVRAAADNRAREVVTPALRGMVLDSVGRPLARNRTALVVSISRTELLRQPDEGRALVARVADVLGRPAAEVWGKTRLCGNSDAPPPPRCWNGSPYQPIPVSDDADLQTALQIMERREEFPGVTAEPQAERNYPAPHHANAAHLLGYLGPLTEEELAARTRVQAGRNAETVLRRTDLVGRSGLEKQYDEDLRGTPGVQSLAVDHRGGVTGVLAETEPTAGNHLVTTIDATVQAAAERQLLAAIKRARTTGDVNKGGKRFRADSGAVVVLDVHTGGIVAMASWPTYDPNVWVGGISTADYATITSKRENYPNQFRATQGEFAPASTFKVISVPAAERAGYALDGSYPCPSSYPIGTTRKRNYESQAFGTISLKRALEVSCDTIFYKFAYETWSRMGKVRPGPAAKDPFVDMAKGFGLGKRTGLDLPSEATGRVADRKWKRDNWNETKAFHCAKAKSGYPDIAASDPKRAGYLKKLSREACQDGWAYRGGDAANFAIGQGDTTATPLQIARVYAAIANGGKLVTPHLGKAIVSPTGELVRSIAPAATGKVPVSPATLRWLQAALRSVADNGTARAAFTRVGFPLEKIPVAAKTGTGEVFGKQSTSWFASYAPATRPQYAVVMMVSQGGTGSGTAGPAVAEIYKTLFGVVGQRVDPGQAAPVGGRPPRDLPQVRSDGTVLQPKSSQGR